MNQIDSPIVETDAETLKRIVARQHRQMATMRGAWIKAAERALTALPGASNSTHPAHSLWLRVEMAKEPPMQVVLSDATPA